MPRRKLCSVIAKSWTIARHCEEDSIGSVLSPALPDVNATAGRVCKPSLVRLLALRVRSAHFRR